MSVLFMVITKIQKQNLKRLCKKPISKITSLYDAKIYLQVCVKGKQRKKVKDFFIDKYGFV